MKVHVQIIERYRPFYLEVWCSEHGRLAMKDGRLGPVVATTSLPTARRAVRAHRAECRKGHR